MNVYRVPLTGGARKVVVIGDVHIPFHDEIALRLALRVIKLVKPDYVVLNGDIVDFFGISRFTKNPARALEFHNEISIARDVIHRIRDAAQGATWIYIEGNHEARMKDYIYRRAPELSLLGEVGVQNLLKLNDLGIIWLEHSEIPRQVAESVIPQVVVEMQDERRSIYIMHGDTFRGSPLAVYPARQMFLRTLRNTVVSHWHRSDQYIQRDYEGIEWGCWVIPCLCLPRPHYDAGRVFGQGVGLIRCVDGDFKVDIISFRNGRAVFDGKEVRP